MLTPDMIAETRVVAFSSPESECVTVQCGDSGFNTTKEALVKFAKSVLETPWMLKPEALCPLS